MKPYFRAALVVGFLVLLAIVWSRRGERSGSSTVKIDVVGVEASSSTSATTAGDAGVTGRFPHAMRDPVKREELRQRLLAAAASAETSAKAEEEARRNGTLQPPARGERQTNDLEEFGRFVAQAIREDFVPMAHECAQDLAARRPDAGGTALVAFELLGDAKIGGVVNDSEIDRKESTLNDEPFETCMRESMYAVYFDPPPAGGRATLRFPVSVAADGNGTVDEQVEDFHMKDKR